MGEVIYCRGSNFKSYTFSTFSYKSKNVQNISCPKFWVPWLLPQEYFAVTKFKITNLRRAHWYNPPHRRILNLFWVCGKKRRLENASGPPAKKPKLMHKPSIFDSETDSDEEVAVNIPKMNQKPTLPKPKKVLSTFSIPKVNVRPGITTVNLGNTIVKQHGKGSGNWG